MFEEEMYVVCMKVECDEKDMIGDDRSNGRNVFTWDELISFINGELSHLLSVWFGKIVDESGNEVTLESMVRNYNEFEVYGEDDGRVRLEIVKVKRG